VNAADTALVCVFGPMLSAGLVFVTHMLVDTRRDALWPRGLRWFPRAWLRTAEGLHRGVLRVFWPERLAAHKPDRLLRLEAMDRDWRLWAKSSDGGVPEWKPWPSGGGRWTPRTALRALCPCGYGDECAVWCGSGHADGSCPEHSPEPLRRPGDPFVDASPASREALRRRADVVGPDRAREDYLALRRERGLHLEDW
jgi:hypothetical protein